MSEPSHRHLLGLIKAKQSKSGVRAGRGESNWGISHRPSFILNRKTSCWKANSIHGQTTLVSGNPVLSRPTFRSPKTTVARIGIIVDHMQAPHPHPSACKKVQLDLVVSGGALSETPEMSSLSSLVVHGGVLAQRDTASDQRQYCNVFFSEILQIASQTRP